MKFFCKIQTPKFEKNEKKYIKFLINDDTYKKVVNKHKFSEYFVNNIDYENPLYGNILTVKVPFRYRRVMCTYEGAPVQALQKNDEVFIEVDFMGSWNKGNYSGMSWKLKYIKLIDAHIP